MQGGRARWIGAASLGLLLLCWFPGVAAADISGLLEFDYFHIDSETEDKATKETSKSETDSFRHRYHLRLKRYIYPYLALSARGIFDQSITRIDSEEVDTKLTQTILSPAVELSLGTLLYSANVGYTRRESKTQTEGFPTARDIYENYNGFLGWRPSDLPSLEVRLDRTNFFDRERAIRDTVVESASLGSVYIYEGLNVRYYASVKNTEERLDELETKTTAHNGRVSYSERFFENRISLDTTYDVSYSETEIIAKGAGDVTLQVPALSGLSALDDTPADGELDSNQALIDSDIAASSGINIGVPPPAGDIRPRNIGLGFVSDEEVNILRLWVDRNLPGQVIQFFAQELRVYTSPNNLDWALVGAAISVTFGVFENRFELEFPEVSARYIKIVVPPLDPVLDPTGQFSEIFVTELKSFIKRPVGEVSEKTSDTSHFYTLNARARLLDTPVLFYRLSFSLTSRDDTTYTLSNGLGLIHRLSRVFSASADVAREDGKTFEGDRFAYRYGASIKAVPLRSLSHTLIYSGRTERVDGGKSSSDTVFLYNSAQLYSGVNVDASGGISWTLDEDVKRKNSVFNVASRIVPHHSLTLNISYAVTASEKYGGGLPGTAFTTRQGRLTVAFRPIRTLSLFSSVSVISNGEKRTTQNYAVDWSPFPDGTLQVSIAYSEFIRPEEDRKDKTFRPSLRWSISRRTVLEVTYSIFKSSTETEERKSNAITAKLRKTF